MEARFLLVGTVSMLLMEDGALGAVEGVCIVTPYLEMILTGYL